MKPYTCKTCGKEVDPFFGYIDIYYRSKTFAEFFCDKECHVAYFKPVSYCGTAIYFCDVPIPSYVGRDHYV